MKSPWEIKNHITWTLETLYEFQTSCFFFLFRSLWSTSNHLIWGIIWIYFLCHLSIFSLNHWHLTAWKQGTSSNAGQTERLTVLFAPNQTYDVSFWTVEAEVPRKNWQLCTWRTFILHTERFPNQNWQWVQEIVTSWKVVIKHLSKILWGIWKTLT